MRLGPTLSWLLAGAVLATGPALPAAAQLHDEDTVNDEVALAVVDPTGLPIEARLISRVATGAGPERIIEDPASTTNVSYRDRRGSPQTYADGVLLPIPDGEPEVVVTQALFDKPMPVALHARYVLEGRTVNPLDALGAAGDLAVTYTVTNTTVSEESIEYQDADGAQLQQTLPVFAPFSGSLVVTVPDGMTLIEAPGAAQTADERGRRVLRFDVLLAPPAGDFQQQFDIRLQAERLTTPEAVLSLAPVTSGQSPPLGFAADLLEESLAASVQIADGLRELDAQTGLLVEGAAGLADGAAQLARGQAILASSLSEGADGAADLVVGTDLLVAALADLEAGLVLLAGEDGLGIAAASAADLARGAALLADIVGSSADGPFDPQIEFPAQGLPPDLPAIPEWGGALPEWTELLVPLSDAVAAWSEAGAGGPPETLGLPISPDGSGRDGVCDLDADGDGILDIPITDIDCLPTLVQSLRVLSQAAVAAGEVAAEIPVLLAGAKDDLAAAAAGTGEASGAAGAAAQGAAALLVELCGEPPALTPRQCDDLRQVADEAASAAQSAGSAESDIASGVAQLAPAAATAAGLAVGLPLLGALLGVTEQVAAFVGDGLRSGAPESPGLVEGLGLLADGVDQAARAAGALADGAGLAQRGSAELSGAVGSLTAGLAAAADGSAALESAAGQLSDGSAILADGAGLLREEGTAPALAGAVDGSAEAALADAYLRAVDERAADAMPYGAPEGARGQAAYVLHMPSVAPSPAVPWWLAAVLAVLLAAGLAAALLRSRGPRRQQVR